jgi:hypothetical protein
MTIADPSRVLIVLPGPKKGQEGMRTYMRQKSIYQDTSGVLHPWARLQQE